MAVYTHVSAEALGEFLTRYDVGELVSAKGIAEGVENSNYMVDTTKGRYFLTLYEKRVNAADLPFFMALLEHLAATGNPVPRMLPDSSGMRIQALEGRPACLIEFLPGVSPSYPNAEQAWNAGYALGRMHASVFDFTSERPNTLGPQSWRELLERCGTGLETIQPGMYSYLGAAVDRVLAHWPKLDRCVIHADLFPDNVLMLGDKVTGLIDFYFACTDLRAYDFAIMHSAWTFNGDGQQYNAAVAKSLLLGYDSAQPISHAEAASLPILAQGACIRFTLTRAWDWLNTPADALVTLKNPLAYLNRLDFYAANPGIFA